MNYKPLLWYSIRSFTFVLICVSLLIVQLMLNMPLFFVVGSFVLSLIFLTLTIVCLVDYLRKDTIVWSGKIIELTSKYFVLQMDQSSQKIRYRNKDDNPSVMNEEYELTLAKRTKIMVGIRKISSLQDINHTLNA